MKLTKTSAEAYWQDHGGSEWKSKIDKRVHQAHYVNQLRLIDKVFSKLNFKGKSVLEVGCGFGRILKYLEDTLGIKASGLDQSEKMLKLANKLGINNKRLINANIRDLPKRTKRYDTIFTCEALIHVHPYHLLGVLENMFNKANDRVIHVETSPVKDFYSDDCHAGFWKHDYLGAYRLIGKKVKLIKQEGTKHSAYIICK